MLIPPAQSERARTSDGGSHRHGVRAVAPRWRVVAVGVVLAGVIATLGVGIARSEGESRSHILSVFKLRGTSSATFVSTFLSQQVGGETRTGRDLATLRAFVDHTIAYRPHDVYLLDASGDIIAASPRTGDRRLEELDPALARAMRRSSPGPVGGKGAARTFTVAGVPGTSWRLVIAVPDSRLFASIEGWPQKLPWLVFAIVSVLAAALLLVFARLTALSERTAMSARTDALTDLPNRRSVNEHLVRATAHARRTGSPVSVLMIDLDRFKATNDRYGHRAGDKVLRAVAGCIREALRTEDIYGRWGGDEFLVLLPDTDEQEAEQAAERLRRRAERVELGDIGLPGGVPMSIGTATHTLTTPEDIVEAADVDLYRKKHARRHGEGHHDSQLELGLWDGKDPRANGVPI